MALEIEIYERKPLKVEVVTVTPENFEEVAKWTDGVIIHEESQAPYIKIQTFRPKTENQTRAFYGSLVLKSDNGFKIYNKTAFDVFFQKTQKKLVWSTSDDLRPPLDCVS